MRIQKVPWVPLPPNVLTTHALHRQTHTSNLEVYVRIPRQGHFGVQGRGFITMQTHITKQSGADTSKTTRNRDNITKHIHNSAGTRDATRTHPQTATHPIQHHSTGQNAHKDDHSKGKLHAWARRTKDFTGIIIRANARAPTATPAYPPTPNQTDRRLFLLRRGL